MGSSAMARAPGHRNKTRSEVALLRHLAALRRQASFKRWAGAAAPPPPRPTASRPDDPRRAGHGLKKVGSFDRPPSRHEGQATNGCERRFDVINWKDLSMAVLNGGAGSAGRSCLIIRDGEAGTLMVEMFSAADWTDEEVAHIVQSEGMPHNDNVASREGKSC
jgi:hypothetical protein